MPTVTKKLGTDNVEIVIDGETIIKEEGWVIAESTPNRGGGATEIIRHMKDNSKRWKWNAPVADWNDTVSTDPDVEVRWLLLPTST